MKLSSKKPKLLNKFKIFNNKYECEFLEYFYKIKIY